MTAHHDVTFNGVLVARTIDHGDGTGQHLRFNADGTVASTEDVTGLPIPEPEQPDPVAELQAQVAELQTALNALTGNTPS
jgi:hypothetical protein